MPAFAIPELIEPGELYIPDGKTGFSIADGVMPNTDNAFLLTEEAGVENFQAYQDSIGAGPAARAPHLLTEAACSLSFWIRRRQLFDSGWNGIPVNSVQSQAFNAAARMVMGVMDPLGVAVAPGDRTISWAIFTSGTSEIQMAQLGYIPTNNYYWYGTERATLVQDRWHLIVVTREAADFATITAPGRARLYLDGNSLVAPSYVNWHLYPNPVNAQRFGFGDLTTLGRTVGGASAGPAVDIAKVAFHNRVLTPADMLQMIDSMNNGPAS